MKYLIGFTGKKGSGKDTVAQAMRVILEAEGRPVIMTAFADSIRDEVAKIMNCIGWTDAHHPRPFKRYEAMDPYEPYFDWEKFKTEHNVIAKDYQVSGRDLFRGIGMLMRSYDEEQFVNYVLNQYQEAPDGAVIMVTDVRFDNEAEMITSLGGKIVEVMSETPEDQYTGSGSLGGPKRTVDQHVTELGIHMKYPRTTFKNIRVINPTPASWFRLSTAVSKLVTQLDYIK